MEALCLHCGKETFLGGGSEKAAEKVLAKYRELRCFECDSPIDVHQYWAGGLCGSCADRNAREECEWKERKRYRRPPPGDDRR